MHDATVERLSKIISDPRSRRDRLDSGKDEQRPAFHIHIGLAEGWFSLFLVTTIVYSTIWSVQAVAWVPNLNILTITTALGLICGVIAAKQRRLPRLAVHSIAIVLGLLVAFWQTAGADYAGNVPHFMAAIHQWIVLALAGGTSGDASIFLLFITALGFLLAYTSAWLVYRTRSPWLMIVANAIVLLINLSNVTPGFLIFLVVFLLATMLLLLRFNLYESTQRWRRQGLRCSDDLGWDFMQAGLLISIAILILSWVLPFGYTNQYAAQIWSANSNPWVQIQNTWNRLIAVNGGTIPSNRGNFTDALFLGGNPNLNNDVVFNVSSSEGPQYIESLSYDNYNGRGWTNSPTYSSAQDKNQLVGSESVLSHQVQQSIQVVNPPGEQLPYVFGAPQIASVNQPATILTNKSSGSTVAWLNKDGTKLAAGDQYTVVSYASSADIQQLSAIPFPRNAPQLASNYDGPIPVNYFDPSILHTYLQLPPSLDPNILELANQITANAPTMYDKTVALESYLRTFTYSVNVQLPSGEEGTSWLLFRSGRRAYCNYFATAMAVMARLLGIPARVVAGYSPGEYDAKTHEWVIRGSNAHLWTQVYFAGYGWINFEPSPSFATFDRPLPNQFNGTGNGSNGSGSANPPVAPRGRNTRGASLDQDQGSSGTTAQQTPTNWVQPFGFTLGSLVLLILLGLLLFSIWWRRLFRHQRIANQIYGRICLLANWAGVSLRRSYTPNEYIHELAVATPEQIVPLERFGDIYVREIWADPESSEHPERSGEVNELPGLWRQLQPRLFAYVIRHPYFLRRLLVRVDALIKKQRAHNTSLEDVIEEDLDQG